MKPIGVLSALTIIALAHAGEPAKGGAKKVDLGGGVTLEVVFIPPGEFMMGSTPEEKKWATGPEGGTGRAAGGDGRENYEGDPRLTRIKNGFWMGRTELTVGQWRRFVEETGYVTDAEKGAAVAWFDWQAKKWQKAGGKGWRDPGYGFPVQDHHPVACVSWNDSKAFCRWLTKKERAAKRLPKGMEYRLPTDAEWEYACRGGRTSTIFWWGNDLKDGAGRLNIASDDPLPGNKEILPSQKAPWLDGFVMVSPVDHYGDKGRNGFGLADMLGNVWEICLDHWDPKGAHEGVYFVAKDPRPVCRGASFMARPGYARCAVRLGLRSPDYSDSRDGFRVCLGRSVAVEPSKFAKNFLAGGGHFKGWVPNKPGYWDDEGSMVLNKIPGIEKTALRLTSISNRMHMCSKQVAVERGDKIAVKSLMRGAGAGSLGVYYYPGGGSVQKEFKVSADWAEFAAELSLPDKVTNICVVVGIPPCASAEFLDTAAEIIKEGQQQDSDNPPTADAKGLPERLWRAANVKEAFLAGKEGDKSFAVFMGLKRKAKAMLAGKDLAEAAGLLSEYETLKAEFSVPVKRLVFEVKARQAKDLSVWVNGQAVTAKDGRWPIRLIEGLNVVGMTAAADGKKPGLRLRVPGQSELETRWRAGIAAGDDWKAAAFDDRSWAKAEVDPEGYLRIPDGSNGNVCFRQLILWSESHHSGLPCIQPKVREWGFSEKSLEPLFHTLYTPPPLAFPLEEYQFILDVPKEFKLLDEKYADGDQGEKLNIRQRSVTVEEASHNNRPYTRYRFAVASQFVQSDKFKCLLIPLILNEWKGADKSCAFRFRRLASGNLTELEQTLPVRVLPPLNGRMPKKVMLSQYCAEPWVRMYCGKLFPAHFEAFMRQSLDLGFNYWILPPGGDAYTKKVYDRVIERGGVVVLWGPNNYPLWGSVNATWALGKLMQETPELRARFFNEAERVKTTAQFCRSFATGAGAARFKEAVKKDIGMMLHGSAEHKLPGFPKAAIYWNDWECTPWGSPDVKDYKCFCFCDNCKRAFRQYAKLPDTADLSDDAIQKNHKKEWSLFRNELDGRMNGIVREACNELGLQYMYYDQVAFPDNWPPLKGKIDIAFPGWPGAGQAVGYGPVDGVGTFPVNQQSLDREMAFIREKVGLPRITGQLFASSAYGLTKPLQTWPQTAIAGRDGFMNAARLKPQILRIVASFHGGVDLDTAVERCAGQQYYIGEATRAISDFEDLFYDGKREDGLAVSAQIKYPNMLVLTNGSERLVLLFNEGGKPLEVELENRELKAGQTAAIWGKPGRIGNPARMKVTVSAEDVTLVHIK